MLWRQLMHSVADNQKTDRNAKGMVHSFSRDGSRRVIPQQIHIVHAETGEQIMEIAKRDYLEKPDHDYWLKKASRKNPDIAIHNLTINFRS